MGIDESFKKHADGLVNQLVQQGRVRRVSAKVKRGDLDVEFNRGSKAPKESTKAPVIKGTFGNSNSALSYERRIIERFMQWGIRDGKSPAEYIHYRETYEVPEGPTGVPLFENCELCGHAIMYVNVCDQIGPLGHTGPRKLGSDCIYNYGMVSPSEQRLAELNTKNLQKEAAKRSKEKREEARKVEYADVLFADVLVYIEAWRILHGAQAHLPSILFYAKLEIEKGRHGEKKMAQFINPARDFMKTNPLNKLADEKAERAAQDATTLAARREKYGKHLDFIVVVMNEQPGNDFWGAMYDKFKRHLNDISGWEPTVNMVTAVEKEMRRRAPQDQEQNYLKYQDIVTRVEAIAHIQWSTKAGYAPGLGRMPSQMDKFKTLDDIAGKLVEQGGFASEKQQEHFMKTLEQLEKWAVGKEVRR